MVIEEEAFGCEVLSVQVCDPSLSCNDEDRLDHLDTASNLGAFVPICVSIDQTY